MRTLSIFLIAYFAVAIIIMIVILYRNQSKSLPGDETNNKMQLWKVVAFLPFYPIAVILGLIKTLFSSKRRNRAVMKHLKTKTDFQKEYKELKVDRIDVEDGVEDSLQKKASWSLAEGLKDKNLSEFKTWLDDNVSQIIYDEKYDERTFDKINGKTNVERYWNGWLVRQAENGITHKYRIIRAKYFQTAALQIGYYNKEKHYCGEMLVLFSFSPQEKIRQIIFMGTHIWYTNFLEEKRHLLSTLESLELNMPMTGFENGKHLPCPKCGLESSKLLWFGYDDILHGGKVSFCTHCKEIVEYYINIHFSVASDYHSPISDNIEYIEKKIAEGYSGGSYTYYDKPIGWQNHIYFYDESVLDLGQPAEWSEEKKLQYAIEKGEYEAYNNLALHYIDEDDDKTIEYFKLAVENNILTGILNLSMWYYKHNDIPNFIEYTRLAAENKNVIAMYNLAFAQFSNEYGIQDTKSAIEQYRETIEECGRIEYDVIESEEEKEILKEWDNTVLQRCYYDLAVIYYRKGEFGDLLLSYAYLNKCPRQIEMVKDLKATVYARLLDRHTEYEDLPF